jgi:hypothetical protein
MHHVESLEIAYVASDVLAIVKDAIAEIECQGPNPLRVLDQDHEIDVARGTHESVSIDR